MLGIRVGAPKSYFPDMNTNFMQGCASRKKLLLDLNYAIVILEEGTSSIFRVEYSS